jgi:hypothetical protein
MQVLSPEQSLQEAAIALKALASGDTTSLVTRFEVSRDVANQMKNEIAGGADAVAVMSKFLGDAGIGMDALAAKASGAQGKIKDAAIAAEELKLAQADFAQGPGLVILQQQIDVTRGATRLLTGDVDAMGASLANMGAVGQTAFTALTSVVPGAASVLQGLAVQQQTAAATQDQHTAAVQYGTAAMANANP